MPSMMLLMMHQPHILISPGGWIDVMFIHSFIGVATNWTHFQLQHAMLGMHRSCMLQHSFVPCQYMLVRCSLLFRVWHMYLFLHGLFHTAPFVSCRNAGHCTCITGLDQSAWVRCSPMCCYQEACPVYNFLLLADVATAACQPGIARFAMQCLRIPSIYALGYLDIMTHLRVPDILLHSKKEEVTSSLPAQY